jgi:hypothetical protein
VTERTESPDGSRRAAFVGALYRTARAVPLLCRTGAVHGTSMAMECSDLSELWISLGLRASRTTGGTGRLAPCRFCAEQARYTARRWLWSAPTCRSFGFPWGSELRERQAEPDGSRRAAFVGVRNRTARAVPLLWEHCTGRLAPCRWRGRRRVRLWGRSAESRIPGTTPKPVRRTNRITGRLAPCRYCGSTAPDGSRRAAFVSGRERTAYAVPFLSL